MLQVDLPVAVTKIISEISNLIPEYMNNQHDKPVSDGNVAVCIIDIDGNISGKMFGTDKNRSRQSFKIACTKASQVWITGMKTGEYEKKVFNKEIDEHQYGIQRPDFIGWDGGQPIKLKDGTVLSVGFSGFRGTSDLEIVQKAVAKAGL
ncbi:MAG TPA: heme-binding protein [Candidatus Kryptonia bacterium]